MMKLLAWLVPGLVQWQAGRRAAAMMLILAAAGVIAVAVVADLGYLEIHSRLRAPRSVARDVWAEKGAARRDGLLAFAVVVALGLVHGLATLPSPSLSLRTDSTRKAIRT